MHPLPNPLVASLTVGTIGLFSKAFLALCCRTRVTGLEHLYNAWNEEHRKDRGILTVCNHISVLDDPLMWGILPLRSYFFDRTSRWTLGARDIMFTNPVYSTFFRNGKVIDTVRGGGIYQLAMDLAINKLNKGDWVHMFPQGFVRQQTLTPPTGRLKWGVGRMLAECQQTPVVIPIWINGFDQIMPEDRGFPKFLPRLGAKIQVTFGDPKGVTSKLDEKLAQWREERKSLAIDREGMTPLHIDLTKIVEQSLDSLGHRIHS
ncbi:hypothetical protein CPB86DRAFT_783761 [Serendipita vermifera]|nr:hypothetical protein CPB86DRAFT_783761 [Serendipita vermifera]